MLSTNFTEKLLELKGVIVKNITQNEKIIEILIEMALSEQRCPCCGATTRTTHDYRTQPVKDIPAFGKNIILILRKRRYRCLHCGKRFFEQNTFLPRYHRMTNRLSAYVIDKLSDVRSFTSVSREVNLSVSTVIRIFDFVKYTQKKLPGVISIDEFKGNTNGEKYQCIITDPVNKTIVDILPARYKHTLTNYFRGFERQQTTHFISDMWSTYSDISQTYFKNATYIVDKYHFIRQVIWSFEAVRKEFKRNLAGHTEFTSNAPKPF
jgi:transposase